MSIIFPKYILTCKNVIHHEKDDTFSYENVFESIEVPEIPYKLNFYLVLGIEYTLPKKSNRKIIIKLMDPDDNKVSEDDLVIELAPAIKNQIRFSLNIIDVAEFNVSQDGIYSISVIHNGTLLTRHDFMIERGVKIDPDIIDTTAIPI